MSSYRQLTELAKRVRRNIIVSTTKAGSGHPSSSVSAVELATMLFFGGYLRFDLKKPKYGYNDRFILSKGHASPLLYSLYEAAGVVSEKELLNLRTIQSKLEGHPTPRFPFVDYATGSLGQGISLAIGAALGIRLQMKSNGIVMKREPKMWVLLGDSEMAEGQIWESLEVASHYHLNNIVGITDVNRLGQQAETMLGWDLTAYEKRISSFGWDVIRVEDGHNLKEVQEAFQSADMLRDSKSQKPVMIIAKTIKGKGVSLLENKNGWHGKTLSEEQAAKALREIGMYDKKIKGSITLPETVTDTKKTELKDLCNRLSNLTTDVNNKKKIAQKKSDNNLSPREAFGEALEELGSKHENIVVFDGEVANSTYEDKFASQFPDRFFEMYIAEQNMVTAGAGISKTGFTPVVSTFAAFLTRSFDQIRMAQYSNSNLKIVGSHAGSSIGEDGSSQMGLEDIAMMRSILHSTVLYPSDAVSARALTRLMIETVGMVYLRTTRKKLPQLYKESEEFKVGGSKILMQSDKDCAVIFAAGVSVHESLKAAEMLKKRGKNVAVVDIYSIKPLDNETIVQMAKKTGIVVVVEDHYPGGGIGDAISSSLIHEPSVHLKSFVHLAVKQDPHSGSSEDVLKYERIDAEAITNALL